jgi:hypothetical protein
MSERWPTFFLVRPSGRAIIGSNVADQLRVPDQVQEKRLMARRLVASGNAIVAAGGLVYQVTPGMAGPVLVDITAAFPASATNHSHYEIGTEAAIGATFGGPPPPPGSLWVIASTHPPGPMVWPFGARHIQLVTSDPQTSMQDVGTMKTSATGNSVYIARNIVFWIPTAAFGPGLPVPTNTVWDVDF